MIKGRKCFYCNTELKVIKEGYTITNFYPSVNDNKDSVEVIKTYLCKCNMCDRKEVIKEEEPSFIGLEELYDAIKDDRVFSDNPEVMVLFKIIKLMK